MYLPDKVYCTYKVSTSNHCERDMFNEYSTLDKQKKFNTINLLCTDIVYKKSLVSETSSTGSGFESYAGASKVMKKHGGNNNYGIGNKRNYAQNKNVNSSDFSCSSEMICNVIPNPNGDASVHETIKTELINVQTFQQYTSREQTQKLQSSRENLKEMASEYKKATNYGTHNKIRCPKHSPVDQEIKLERTESEIIVSSDKLDNSLRISFDSLSELSTSDADSTIYKQSMAQYNNDINGFIEKAFQKSSSHMMTLLTRKKSNNSQNEKETRNCRDETNVKVNPQCLHDEDNELNDNASDISARKISAKKETNVSKANKPKNKTPKTRKEKIQRLEYNRKEKVTHEMVEVNLINSDQSANAQSESKILKKETERGM